jgi:NADPH2:quinone reductase
VIGTASQAAKLERIVQYGADYAVDATDEAWPAQVQRYTLGRGADVIFEMAGGRVGTQSLECLAEGGRILLYGMASGAPPSIDPVRLMFRNQSIIGFTLNQVFAARQAQAVRRVMERVVSGQVRVEIGEVFPLAEAARAHRAMASRSSVGKLILLT